MGVLMSAYNWLSKIFRFATSKGTPKRSIIIALIVGTTLTLINQGSMLMQGIWPPWWKIALTYLVPYLVSTYGAVSSMLSAEKAADKAAETAAGTTESGLMDGISVIKTDIGEKEKQALDVIICCGCNDGYASVRGAGASPGINCYVWPSTNREDSFSGDSSTDSTSETS